MVRYQLKTPWKNGTTHVAFEPVELMAQIPVRHPAVVQIDNPADLSSPNWRRWCHHRVRT